MPKITVALDWTPNTNHVGMFVALERGMYAASGLEVISCHTADPIGKPKLVAVAALLQKQTSAIVTLKSSGIDRPKLLDGRKYASYQGRFEMDIVRQLVKNDGGAGDVIEVCPGAHGLGIFNTLLSDDGGAGGGAAPAGGGAFDATWVFMPWEGVIARRRGVDLNVFSLDDIPYGYTPVLVAHPDLAAAAAGGGGGGGDAAAAAAARSFLAATEKGYREAAADPAAAAAVLVKFARQRGIELTADMVADSAAGLTDSFLDSDGRYSRAPAAALNQ